MDDLNEKQKEALLIMKNGKNIFLTGPAGTGKTYLLKKFINEYKYHPDTLGITSTTGISALHINGITLHSLLGIGLGKEDAKTLIKRIRQRNKSKTWKELKVLIIDEVSMLSGELFDKLNEIAKMIRRNLRPFGGIQLILSGDFLQLPCIDGVFCFLTFSWKECITNIIYLTEIVRQSDTTLQKCLSEVRLGTINKETLDILNSRTNIELINQFNIIPTKLFSTNREVDAVNREELEKLIKKNGYSNEYILEYNFLTKYQHYKWDTYMKDLIVPEKLELTIGCQVMLIRNLNVAGRLANGSRGIVTNFEDDIPEVTFLEGQKIIINYEEYEIEDKGKTIGKYYQIPLKLGYAFSIHKTQGLTLDYVEIDMKNIFEKGQAYVALSRIKNIEGLSIKNFIPSLIMPNPIALKFYENY